MTFDQYWRSLVDRVLERHERLAGSEEIFFRLSCIYGECMVDGIEAYFDRRFADFDADMAALDANGFSDLVQEFQQSRTILFGDQPLSAKVCDETKISPKLESKIDKIYRRLIPRFEALADCRDQLGLRAGFYTTVE